MAVREALESIAQENHRVRVELGHPKLNSYHEGYGLLMEEVQELFEEIRQRYPEKDEIYTEAMHVAQVAVRRMAELCGEGETE